MIGMALLALLRRSGSYKIEQEGRRVKKKLDRRRSSPRTQQKLLRMI